MMNLRWYVDEVNQAEPVLQVWKELAGEWVTVPTVTRHFMADEVVAFDPPPAGEHEWLVDELKPEVGDG